MTGARRWGMTAVIVALQAFVPVSAPGAEGTKGRGTEDRAWVNGSRPADVSPDEFPVVITTDVPVTMRDGKVLRVDVYRPDAPGRFPCVVNQPGYGKTVFGGYGMVGAAIASRGYMSVVADIRGTGNSEGELHPYSLVSQQDGYDLVEWTASQPWCNGKVGVHGVSWGAITSYLTAKQLPPHLEAMIPIQGAGDLYRGLWYVGGMAPGTTRFMWDAYSQTTGVGGGPLVPPTCGADCVPAYADHLAQSSKSFYVEALQHPTFDAWWRERATIARDHRMMARHGIATLFQDGWHDYFLWATTRAFVEYNTEADHLGSSLPRSRSKRSMLIIGPWTHSDDSGVQPHTFAEYQVMWWDRWLKGKPNEIDQQDYRVLMFVQGPDQWRFEKDWPIPDARPASLFLRAAKSGTGTSLNDGSLSTTAGGPLEAPASYDYVPANNSGSSGSTTVGVEIPAHDQRVEEMPSLTWTSVPLADNTEVTGPGRFIFHASATSTDTDFVVELTDVAPDGSSNSVTQGWLRASHRSSDETPTPLVPGQIYNFTIEVYPTSYVFAAGHRIRVALSGADVPIRLPSTQPATVTVYEDAARQSHIELPVIGTSRLSRRQRSRDTQRG